MGWKGFVRSVNAQARRSRIESDRAERSRDRALNQVDRALEALNAEAQREVEKVRKFSSKVDDTPIKAIDLDYTKQGAWTTKPFADTKGKITYDLEVKPRVADVRFEPTAVMLGDIRLAPLSLSFTRQFVALAVEVSTIESTVATLKLTSRGKPENSRIVLITDDQDMLYPLESTLDGQVFPGVARIGVVAFEPFQNPVAAFEIAVVPKAKRGEDVEPIKIKLSSTTLATQIGESLAEPSIIEQFTQQITAAQSEWKAKADKAREGAKGCMVVMMVGLMLVILSVATVVNWI